MNIIAIGHVELKTGETVYIYRDYDGQCLFGLDSVIEEAFNPLNGDKIYPDEIPDSSAYVIIKEVEN
jgi:hypothetical protein